MRPAYITRCYVCGVRIVIADEMQEDKDKDGKVVKWFDPDRIVERHVRRSH
jgi:hypothetical protein